MIEAMNFKAISLELIWNLEAKGHQFLILQLGISIICDESDQKGIADPSGPIRNEENSFKVRSLTPQRIR